VLRKGKKRKQEEQFAESQRGALHKFFPISSNAEVSQDQGLEDHTLIAEVDPNERATEEQNLDAEASANDHTSGDENLQPSDDTANIDAQEESLLTLFDPRTWGNLDNSKRDVLIEK
jgi:hypothetical protein